jgi:hypothetical protein
MSSSSSSSSPSSSPSSSSSSSAPPSNSSSSSSSTNSHSITSQTVVTSPQNRARTKVGVGEEVTLTFVPNHLAAWTINGPGKIDGNVNPVQHKNKITFTAPDTTPLKTAAAGDNPPVYKSSTTTITAVCETADGGTASITFTTIRPNALKFKFKEWNPGLAFNGQPLSYSFQAYVYILPADVNFEKIKTYEDVCTSQTTGFFNKFANTPVFVNHPKGAENAMDKHLQGKGTLMVGHDLISMTTEAPNANPAIPPVPHKGYVAGTFKWVIPTKYVLNGDKGEFAKGTFTAEITVNQQGIATMTGDKNGPLVSVDENGTGLPQVGPQQP